MRSGSAMGGRSLGPCAACNSVSNIQLSGPSASNVFPSSTKHVPFRRVTTCRLLRLTIMLPWRLFAASVGSRGCLLAFWLNRFFLRPGLEGSHEKSYSAALTSLFFLFTCPNQPILSLRSDVFVFRRRHMISELEARDPHCRNEIEIYKFLRSMVCTLLIGPEKLHRHYAALTLSLISMTSSLTASVSQGGKLLVSHAQASHSPSTAMPTGSKSSATAETEERDKLASFFQATERAFDAIEAGPSVDTGESKSRSSVTVEGTLSGNSGIQAGRERWWEQSWHPFQ